MKLSEATAVRKPKKNDLVVDYESDPPEKIQTISKGVAYVGSTRLPIMLSQLTFVSKKGNVITWKANY